MNKLAALAVAVLAVTAGAFAQETPQPYVESIEVRVANIEVVVTDSNNRPIRNLTQADFELFENGKPQTITNFFEERDDVRPPSTAAATTGAASGEQPGMVVDDIAARPRHIVFFLDDYATHPSKRKELFDALERFADNTMRPGDKAMVATWNRTLTIHLPFSSDRDAVKGAIRKALTQSAGGYFTERKIVEHRVRGYLAEAIMGLNDTKARLSFEEAFTQSITTVNNFSEEQNKRLKNLILEMEATLRTLSGVEGRKAMVFAGQQLPQHVNREVYQLVDELFLPWSHQFKSSELGRLSLQAGRYNQVGHHDSLAKEANKQGVALYMIHPTGLEPFSGADEKEQTSEVVRFEEFNNTAFAFNDLSKRTGGLALAAGRNFDLVFDAVSQDLGSYYSLGYRPSGDARGRDVDVRINKPGLRVRFRKSITVRPFDEEVGDAVVANAFVTPSRNELTVSLHASDATATGRRKRTVPIEVRVLADQLALIPQGDEWAGGITILFSTAEPKGRFSDIDKKQQAIRMKEKPKPGEYISYNVDLVFRSNDQIVSVAVIDNVSKSVGYARETFAKVQ